MVVIMENKLESNKAYEFEKEYFPCAKEWWCVEGFFTTIENNKKWSFKGDFYQAIGKDKTYWSVFSITIFDLDKNKNYFFQYADESSKLDIAKEKFYIKFGKTYIKGSFPNYQMNLFDPIDNITLNLKYKAESLPYWVAQKTTDGWLPWSLGYYRYGFIPKNKIEGTIDIDGEKLTFNGEGYFEHIWGNFSFLSMSSSRRSIKKSISMYTKLIGNWIHNQEFKIPKSIMFGTDNRAPGYDWIWAILDNGWSIFFGNMMLWIMEGPATGTLILSKDGINYNEFSNIYFKYNKMKYLKDHDFYYPIELEICATKGHEKLYLKCKNITEGFQDLARAKKVAKFGFMICQVPCKLDGYYINGNKKSSIKGLSKMEFHRTLRPLGHNSLKINFDISKNRFGIFSSFDSHYFRKKLDINFYLLPKPNLKINFDRINKPQLK